jgi:hypothetical protein
MFTSFTLARGAQIQMIDPSQYFPQEDFSPPERPKSKGKILLIKRTAKAPNYERRQLTSGCVLLVMKIQKTGKEIRSAAGISEGSKTPASCRNLLT